MDDFRVEVGFLGHPKTKKLRRRLGSEAVESFLWLWEFCTIEGNNRTDGDLAGMTDEDIELAANWNGDDGALVSTLLEVGYLDGEEGTRKIHKWAKHQPYIANHAKRSDAARNAANARWAQRGHADSNADSCDPHAAGTDPQCPGSESDPDPESDPESEERASRDASNLERVGAEEGWGSPPRPLLDLCPLPKALLDKALKATRKAGTPGWQYFEAVVRRNRNGKPAKPKPKARASPPEEEPMFQGPAKDLVETVVGSSEMEGT